MPDPLSPALAAALAELIDEQRDLLRDAEDDVDGALRTGHTAAIEVAERSLTVHRARLEVLELAERALKGRNGERVFRGVG